MSEILITTTAFITTPTPGQAEGQIMARAMSFHIGEESAFRFKECREGWGVCEGTPENVAKLKALRLLGRPALLGGLSILDNQSPPTTTVWVNLQKTPPREFYDVCVIAGHPPLLMKPRVVGRDTLKGEFEVTFGVDFFRSRLADVLGDDVTVKELVPGEAPPPTFFSPPPPATGSASITKGFLGLGGKGKAAKRRREASGGSIGGPSAAAPSNAVSDLRYYAAQIKVYQGLMEETLKRM